MLSTHEQVPAELLGGGRGRTQREAPSQKGLLLHGVGTGRLLEGRRGALVTPHAEAGAAWGLEATGILHLPGKGTRDTPESGVPSYSQVQNGTRRARGACEAVTQEGRMAECRLSRVRIGSQAPTSQFGHHSFGRTLCPPPKG